MAKKRGKTPEELAKIQVRISDKNAKEYQRRSVASHWRKKALKEKLLEEISAQDIATAIKKGIIKVDMRAIEMFCKLTNQMPAEKIEADINGSISSFSVNSFLEKFNAKK